MSQCPRCSLKGNADDVATHLIDTHKWTFKKSQDWLRHEVQPEAFYEKP